MDARRRGRDVSFPITLILVGAIALWLRAREGDWTLWRLMLLLIPVFILSAGVNLAIEHRRMAAAVTVSAAGAALLAQGLGLVEFSTWALLARAWPLAIVALGLDMVLDRTSWPRLLLATLVGVAIVAGAVMYFGLDREPTTALASRHLSYPVGAAEAATVTLGPAVGSLQLSAASETASLLEVDVSPDPGRRLLEKLITDGQRASVEVRYSGDPPDIWWPGLSGRTPSWTGTLAPGVALDVHVDIGVGSCRLDLTGLEVRDFELDLGVGECTIYLPAVADLRARIDSGIGQTTLVLPGEIEARVQLDTGLATSSLAGDLVRGEDEVQTSGYQQAAVRAEITLNQAIGSAVIRRR